MRMAGADLRQFLNNLNSIHLKLAFTMPHLPPPSFHCEDIDNKTLRLHYYSQRYGLGPVVLGLLKGLAKYCDQPVEII